MGTVMDRPGSGPADHVVFGRPPGIAVPAALRDLCVEQPGWVHKDGPDIANRACWRCSGGPWLRSSFVALWEVGLDPALEDGSGGCGCPLRSGQLRRTPAILAPGAG